MQHESPSLDVQECIRACGECASICAQTAHHCLHMGGEHAGPEHQGMLQDCSQLCGLAVGFMARSSSRARHICRDCAELCDQCADECDRLANGDQPMKECAQACRRCADACEKMAGVAV